MLELSYRGSKTGHHTNDALFPLLKMLHWLIISGAAQRRNCGSQSCSSALCFQQYVTADLRAGMGFRTVRSETSLLQFCQSFTFKKSLCTSPKPQKRFRNRGTSFCILNLRLVKRSLPFKERLFPIFPKCQELSFKKTPSAVIW